MHDEYLNKLTGLPGTLYYGHNEGWGDYGLIYTWEKGDHPKWDNADREKLKAQGIADTAIASIIGSMMKETLNTKK